MLRMLKRYYSALVRFLKPISQKELVSFYKKAGEWYGHVKEVDEVTWLSIIVPFFNSKPEYLDALVESFETQRMRHVELVLVDNGSTSPDTIRWVNRNLNNQLFALIANESNEGIAVATNKGFEKSIGEWVTFLDPYDIIAPFGLKAIYEAIVDHPDAEFFYTDEVRVDKKGKPLEMCLKPAFDPVLLSGMNYINRFSIFKRTRLQSINFLRAEYDSSQNYDLLFRYFAEIPEERIYHIPYPAYFWRTNTTSNSRNNHMSSLSNVRKTIFEHNQVKGYKTQVYAARNRSFHKVHYESKNGHWPKIGVIIPNLNSFNLITNIVTDIYERTDYPNFEVIVVDNGSDDKGVLSFYEKMGEKNNFRSLIEPGSFNFAYSVNKGLKHAECDHYLILNNDVEVIDSGWLKEMVSCLAYSNTGIVGAKLLYSDKTIQHAGVIVGLGGKAGHWFRNASSEFPGSMGRLNVRNTLTCVTGAVMLISGPCYKAVGDWDEEHFAVAYNDVDYCIRAHNKGFKIIWTPFAELYHHESVSRGVDRSLKKRRRFQKECSNLKRIHSTENYVDRASNPLVNRSNNRFEFRVPDNKPRVRNANGS